MAENLPAFSMRVTAARCRLSSFRILAVRFSMLSSSRSKDALFMQANADRLPQETFRLGGRLFATGAGSCLLAGVDFKCLQPLLSGRGLRATAIGYKSSSDTPEYSLRYPQRGAISGTDQYSIEIKNLTTGETVILTAVEMTDQEKSVVVRQLLRLSGAPAALWIEDDEPKKPF